jgi:hypothetical protein
MSKKDAIATAVMAVGLVGIGAATVHAQGVALGDPVVFIQNTARAGLLAGGAIGTLAGGYKAVQVWSGGRNVYEAATWLIGGLALFFGTAAVLGFR